jgi:hypothetical protein
MDTRPCGRRLRRAPTMMLFQLMKDFRLTWALGMGCQMVQPRGWTMTHRNDAAYSWPW